jgi:dihydroorotate dehydrogenase (fumarate)
MSVYMRTSYLGMALVNPLVASSSPLTGQVETLLELQSAGIAAVVLPSLFEEQIEHEAMELQRLAEYGSEAFPEALSGYHPEMGAYNLHTGSYLDLIASAKAELTVPVIGSLNGTTRGGWVHHASRIEGAGADAIELNIYLIPTDPSVPGSEVENRYLHLVEAVRAEVEIPLAVKIGPYFSSTANMARRLADAGADGLVLFNRFYQPDIDLEDLRVVPNLHLSHPDEVRLPLRWVAILSGEVEADLAVTTGVHGAEEVLKALLVGANVVMMTSALLRSGPGHVRKVLTGMRHWLDEHEYASIDQLRGSMSLHTAPNPEAFTRANYMKMLTTYTSKAR